MGLRPEYALHHSGYEPFLFAPVWDEQNGNSLSILSAFARLGIDPWGEAARLAAMSPDKATLALAELLAQLPWNGAEPPNYRRLARGLIALLPERPSIRRAQSAPREGRPTRDKKMGIILLLATLVAVLQAMGWLF